LERGPQKDGGRAGVIEGEIKDQKNRRESGGFIPAE